MKTPVRKRRGFCLSGSGDALRVVSGNRVQEKWAPA